MTTYTVYRTSYNDQHEQTDYRKILSTSAPKLATDAALAMECDDQEHGRERRYDVVETEDENVGWVS